MSAEGGCSYFYHQTDAKLLQYRDQFCRICLNPFTDDLLSSIDSQLDNTTALEMLIELTSFETEDNAAFPRVICLHCKTKLEQAYNIRKEFIQQTELLVQMVFQQKIVSYYDKFSSGTSESAEAADPHKTEQENVGSFEEVLFHDISSSDINEPAKAIYNEVLLEDHSSYAKPINEYAYLYEDDVPEIELIKRKAELGRARNRERYLEHKMKKKVTENPWSNFPQTTCYICDKKHDTIIERDYHFREHIAMVPYQCNECNECSSTGDDAKDSCRKDKLVVLRTTEQLNLHFRMHCMPHKCDKCYRRFITEKTLKSHLWNFHRNLVDGLTCEYCGKQFYQRTYFNSHVSRHRYKESEIFKCPICERAFGSRMLLQRHGRLHTGEKKFKCIYCDQSFSRSCNRLAHQRTHTGERCHKCPDCDLAFRDREQLRTHRQTQHRVWSAPKRRSIRMPFTIDEGGTKHYSCQYEGCTFTTVIAHKMSTHKLRHDKRFECDECGKRFSQPSLVKKHKASMHSGKETKRNHRKAEESATAVMKNESTELNATEWVVQQAYLNDIF